MCARRTWAIASDFFGGCVKEALKLTWAQQCNWLIFPCAEIIALAEVPETIAIKEKSVQEVGILRTDRNTKANHRRARGRVNAGPRPGHPQFQLSLNLQSYN
jgi:hypothetical protein